MDQAEVRTALQGDFTDADLTVTLDTGDADAETTANRVLFSRKLHYLISQLVKDSAKLVVRQNEDSNGFETWRRRLYKKFSLPGATRSTSLLTQLLDFKFNPATFEQDINEKEKERKEEKEKERKRKRERKEQSSHFHSSLLVMWKNRSKHFQCGGEPDVWHRKGEEQLWNDDQGDWNHFGESDDWSDWADWAVNAVTELYNDPNSWDQTWDDQLWSWDTWSWDASWDPWGWSSDFTSETWPSEAAPSATAETLAKPKEEASSSSGAATLPVSAVTCQGPLGLSTPKAKPKAKATFGPSTLLMSAVVLGNFGLGNTFSVDGMTNGVVDLNFGGFGDSFEPTAFMAPLETFSLNGRTDENQRIFSVGDLGLQNLNTTFKDVALEQHLVASSLEDSEPWILLDSGSTFEEHVRSEFDVNLSFRPTLAPVDKDEFEIVCNTFHNTSTQGMAHVEFPHKGTKLRFNLQGYLSRYTQEYQAAGLLGALPPLLAFIVVRMAMYGLAKAAVSQTG
ncbi:hypothetical protein AK812_SmicGene24159 [Symbiodinium microadriaticum]|uniref:Uncharacterized protein n=1 Tax=Symbiodinium microadriaticum TaxID=2951 RepID=A0A1Q9DFJ2_SYMMI|nr:hypothetical protein AK812_SmicGene24159 [Symbiodinium microadriaticum]